MEARSNHPPILVTGGTGTLGRLVVARLRHAGLDVRVFSRGRTDRRDGVRQAGEGIEDSTGDLSTGKGIDDAVEGIEIIIHLAGTAKGDELKATNLVRAASRAGVKHLVFISVVGADRVPVASAMDRAMFGYFASKLAAERIVADSGLPYTTLRATQFHQLTLRTAQGMARMPVIPVPSGFRFQPVDGDEVAARLVELALAAPAGLVPATRRAQGVRDDRAGPRIPAGHRQAPADGADAAHGRGSPSIPGGGQPRTRAGRGPPDLGGLPGRLGAVA